ncbi:uncharacterized protein LOC133722367 [Rosa rugosa]|uniref:uncharacterized protein LOC133722367 n=1 Tax=Rosa rugosa TaxID=74645 RepID=UPI002B40A4E3|nr:uncharacterized protein LOC133722367 [Rosa rugosa]
MGSAGALNMASSSITVISSTCSSKSKLNDKFTCGFHKFNPITKICAVSPNGSVSGSASASRGAECSAGDVHKQRSSLESFFCYDKAIPEEIIEKPIGISLVEKFIGNNPRCIDCEAKGAVLCTTCSGSGLYVDSILESQGIIVKVRCLGCGGTGNIMCSECGGRGHCG